MRRISEVCVGEALPPRTIHVDRARLVHYAGASGDRNPIHWDDRFAREVGLPDVIAHGMFTMGAAVQVVVDWVGDAGRVRRYSAKFPGMVVVPYDSGADIEVSAVVKSLDSDAATATIELTATSGGQKALGRALVVVQLDQ